MVLKGKFLSASNKTNVSLDKLAIKFYNPNESIHDAIKLLENGQNRLKITEIKDIESNKNYNYLIPVSEILDNETISDISICKIIERIIEVYY